MLQPVRTRAAGGSIWDKSGRPTFISCLNRPQAAEDGCSQSHQRFSNPSRIASAFKRWPLHEPMRNRDRLRRGRHGRRPVRRLSWQCADRRVKVARRSQCAGVPWSSKILAAESAVSKVDRLQTVLGTTARLVSDALRDGYTTRTRSRLARGAHTDGPPRFFQRTPPYAGT